jgi:hypothetical protein
MTQDELIKQIEDTAEYCRNEGQYVKINHSLPWVDVFHGSGSCDCFPAQYFFQGEEAGDLLDECPDYVSKGDYILWVSQGW